MAGSGAQPQANRTEMGVADSDIVQGGNGCSDIGTYFLGGGAIGPAIRVRYMGPDTTYEEGVGRILPYGGLQDDGTTTVEGVGRRLYLPPAVGCKGGGRFSGGGYLRLPRPEHRSAIYCD